MEKYIYINKTYIDYLILQNSSFQYLRSATLDCKDKGNKIIFCGKDLIRFPNISQNLIRIHYATFYL